MMFSGVPNKLGGDLVVCSKKCVVAAASKYKNGGDSRQSWDHDANSVSLSSSARHIITKRNIYTTLQMEEGRVFETLFSLIIPSLHQIFRTILPFDASSTKTVSS
jgi:hypothetical protein